MIKVGDLVKLKKDRQGMYFEGKATQIHIDSTSKSRLIKVTLPSGYYGIFNEEELIKIEDNIND